MIEKLAYSLGRNDEQPNIDLALELVETKNEPGIREIVGGLSNKTGQIANDCIKVLYEIGAREPKLIATYATQLINLLKSRNNRLIWGAMTAISAIASLNHQAIMENIDAVIEAYETGSVITIDNAISVFAKLIKANPDNAEKLFPIIIKHLENCRPKEVGQHSERAFICINHANAGEFKNVLLKRRESLVDSQKKRVDNLLKRIESERYGA